MPIRHPNSVQFRMLGLLSLCGSNTVHKHRYDACNSLKIQIHDPVAMATRRKIIVAIWSTKPQHS